MPHVRQLGFLARALAMQLRLGIGSALVRFVRALLSVKIHLDITRLETIAITRGVWARGVWARGVRRSIVVAVRSIWLWLRLKTLRGRKALDHGAIDAEMFAAQIGGQGFRHHGVEKLLRELVVVEPRAIVGEHRVVKRV